MADQSIVATHERSAAKTLFDNIVARTLFDNHMLFDNTVAHMSFDKEGGDGKKRNFSLRFCRHHNLRSSTMFPEAPTGVVQKHCPPIHEPATVV